MRKIKYRAFMNNRMMDVMIMEGKPYIYWIGDGDCELTYQEVDCEPMEYVDYEDMDGKEIFENDFIEVGDGGDECNGYTYTSCIYQVVHDHDAAGFVLKSLDGKHFESLEELDGADYFKIIGNAYMNPEVLK